MSASLQDAKPAAAATAIAGVLRAWRERRERPTWLACLILPLLHFASVKLTFACAVSPENEVVVWLPNAVLLAALMHYRGQRAWLLAALVYASDLVANLPVFPPAQAVALGLTNLAEVLITYALLRRAQVSPTLERMQDFGRFVIAGPLIGALASALLAGLVLRTLPGASAPYPTLVLLWWFGDALGLLIYTPLLLAFAQRGREPVRVAWLDVLVIAGSAALAVAILSGKGERLIGVPLTPNLLLPSVLFMAVRLGPRWTSVAVALISLATAWGQTTGHRPFGDAPAHELILRTQEFILILSIVGMGFAVLLHEQKALNRSLEDKVRERTQALEESNSKLGALSATDGLTGIANRRRFDEALANEWLRAQRSGEPLALLLLDVDLFKPYNDRYGHQAGDDCLRAIAQVMSANARRAGDLVARYGGEEFALIAPGTDEDNALALARGILEGVQAMGHAHEPSPHGVVTASIGVAVSVPTSEHAPQQLLRGADRALYEAKAQGRNRVVLAQRIAAT
ncbi:sensor domain-containing diguanylate cyclase [Caldimonas sp. KR1-144]|uniref:sensor domain-containing diguanylate cyclase n=1 Tax=Caldimonas sp. KR1-144 TaxID=3400911 RepID=UPI003C02F650